MTSAFQPTAFQLEGFQTDGIASAPAAGLTVADTDIQQQIYALLPPGLAFQKNDVADQLYQAFGGEPSRLSARLDMLIRESNPMTPGELLPARLIEAGLPDPLFPATTTAQQIQLLLSRWQALGGQTPAFFITLALTIGQAITITEFKQFRVGQSGVGTPLYGDQWANTWQVNASLSGGISNFQIGVSSVGEPLRSWGNAILQALINRYKPAHTTVIFAYS